METAIKVKYLKFILAVMFISAGIAHLIFRQEFTEAIPDIIPFKPTVNILVAVIEIVLGILYFTKLKPLAYKLSLGLLTIYIWAHIHFIQMGSCTSTICIDAWVAWVRLIVIHPILLYSTYFLIKNDRA